MGIIIKLIKYLLMIGGVLFYLELAFIFMSDDVIIPYDCTKLEHYDHVPYEVYEGCNRIINRKPLMVV
jgi:hypothetical protein